VDHKEVTSGKCRSIQKNAALIDLITNSKSNSKMEKQQGQDQDPLVGVDINVQAGTLLSEDYSLLACDLRKASELKALLEEKAHVDYSKPTLVVLECVIAYLDGDATRNILRYLTGSFHGGCCVVMYDMIGPSDPFGQQLIYNVESRGCPLPGIRTFPSKAAHTQLLQETGFTGCVGVHSMLEVYSRYVDKQERGRVERIEFLDELEEWNLIMSHYCLSYAACAKGDPKVFASEQMPINLADSSVKVNHKEPDHFKYMD
jgi:tRNA wybutosine-synthesizing protein 4